MHHPTLLAIAAARAPFDALVHFIGTLVIVASVAWSAYCLINYLIKRYAPPAAPTTAPTVAPTPAPAVAPAPAPPAPVEASPAATAIPAHIVAVIAAAVYSTLGDKQRIISIKPQDSTWEKAGRQTVLTSHRIR